MQSKIGRVSWEGVRAAPRGAHVIQYRKGVVRGMRAVSVGAHVIQDWKETLASRRPMCIRTASAPHTSTKIETVPLEAHDLKKLRSKGTLRGNRKILEDARTVYVYNDIHLFTHIF